MRTKRLTYLAHRYGGIGLCLIFLMFFVSGVVLMYVEFPRLTPVERMAAAPALNLDQARIDPQSAFEASGLAAYPQRIRMGMVLGRPAYHFLPWNGRWVTVFADDGARLRFATPAQALRAAELFARSEHLPYTGLRILDLRDVDQWTVSTAMNPYRPLYRIRVGDAAGTELYVSANTGEVARDTRRWQRNWNWMGAVVHWLFLPALRANLGVWKQVIIWISIPSTILAMTGIVIGIWRYRPRRLYRNRTATPYKGWMLWHHIAGLIFGLVTFTWMFSGLLSVNPWSIFPDRNPSRAQTIAFAGGPVAPGRFVLPPRRAIARVEPEITVKEIEFVIFGGRAFYELSQTPFRSLLTAADSSPTVQESFAVADLVSRASTLVPGARVTEAALLDKFDNYYYDWHDPLGGRRTPVLRVKFADGPGTWLYIDPFGGGVVYKIVRSNRWQRWLYNGLHSLNFPILTLHRPAWDVFTLSLSIGGTVLSLAAIVIGWRRIRRANRRSAALRSAVQLLE